MLPGQLSLPSTEREPIRATLERKAQQPLRPNCSQKTCDVGLFSVEVDQLDLADIEMFAD